MTNTRETNKQRDERMRRMYRRYGYPRFEHMSINQLKKEFRDGTLEQAGEFYLFEKLVESREVWDMSNFWWVTAVYHISEGHIECPDYLQDVFSLDHKNDTHGYKPDTRKLLEVTGCDYYAATGYEFENRGYFGAQI